MQKVSVFCTKKAAKKFSAAIFATNRITSLPIPEMLYEIL